MDYVKTGYFAESDLNFPSRERMERGAVAVLECSQQIPCNPCRDACPTGAIKVDGNINNCPIIDYDTCTGCALCLGYCPGLAIFLADLSKKDGFARITLPYELFPPTEGTKVLLLNRAGQTIGEGIIEKVRNLKKHDRTSLITLKISPELVRQARGFRSIS